MEGLSVASRMAPEAAGRRKQQNKLFCIAQNQSLFWSLSEMLAWNGFLCYISRGSVCNGCGDPFGIETDDKS